MKELNESQERFCKKVCGHILLVAGPGTGKTYSIARKIAYLIENGVDPSSIISITFTNRAASELKERINRYAKEKNSAVFVGTIHKLGLKLIKEYLGEEVHVIDRDHQLEILKDILKDERRARMELKKIQRIKNCMIFNEDGTIYEAYQKSLREKKLFDFEDLILFAGLFLENLEWKNRIEYVIVDEFQDLNRAQYDFISKLVRLHGSFLCAVGDADQSIYGFRGSDVKIFLDLLRDYPDCEIIRLTENYRCVKTIAEASYGLIRNNKMRLDNPIIAKREGSSPVKVVTLPHSSMTGDFIVKEIEKRIGGISHLRVINRREKKGGLSFSDFAVLFRTHHDGLSLKRSFEKSGIPYQIIGERLEENSSSLPRLIGYIKNTLREKDGESLGRLYPKEFFERCSFPIDLAPLVELAKRLFPLTPMDELVNELCLLDASDDFDPSSDSVTLTTIHRAKGLEFSCVFIVALDDGHIPLSSSGDIEEERRLLYVGMTRAKDELFLIHSQNRTPSPFLGELPPSAIERISPIMKKEKKMRLFNI